MSFTQKFNLTLKFLNYIGQCTIDVEANGNISKKLKPQFIIIFIFHLFLCCFMPFSLVYLSNNINEAITSVSATTDALSLLTMISAQLAIIMESLVCRQSLIDILTKLNHVEIVLSKNLNGRIADTKKNLFQKYLMLYFCCSGSSIMLFTVMYIQGPSYIVWLHIIYYALMMEFRYLFFGFIVDVLILRFQDMQLHLETMIQREKFQITDELLYNEFRLVKNIYSSLWDVNRSTVKYFACSILMTIIQNFIDITNCSYYLFFAFYSGSDSHYIIGKLFHRC